MKTIRSDIHSGFKSDKGLKRAGKPNQDSLGVYQSPDFPDYLYVVCDGMGAYRGGEVASNLAKEEIIRTYNVLVGMHPPNEALKVAICRAHDAICKEAANKDFGEMGTTAVVTALHGEMLYVANVGDSRAYLVHNNELCQLTQDHSRVAELVRARIITATEAQGSKVKNVLTRSLTAARSNVEVDVLPPIHFADGDVLILCSDGLWGQVSDKEIKKVAQKFPPQEAADRLVNLANQNGGLENISVIIVRCGELPVVVEEDTSEFSIIELLLERNEQILKTFAQLLTLTVGLTLAIVTLGLISYWLLLR